MTKKLIYVKTIQQEETAFDNFDELKEFVCSDENVRWNFDRTFNLAEIEQKFEEAWLTWAANGFVGRYNFYTAKMTFEDERPAAVAMGHDEWCTNY